ncbi:hypothetical protein O3M35_005254 [Rhynocoris fuscipes]|uniref:Uncharacterized protein n=1 Tax=Rhynocoris fuscipes TaxID=488301 RepID=A0AAW1DPS6_9HEMI
MVADPNEDEELDPLATPNIDQILENPVEEEELSQVLKELTPPEVNVPEKERHIQGSQDEEVPVTPQPATRSTLPAPAPAVTIAPPMAAYLQHIQHS